MAIRIDQPTQLQHRPEWYYLVRSEHRGRGDKQHKSEWTIHPDDEFICFCFSEQSGWVVTPDGWGLLLDVNKQASVLGTLHVKGQKIPSRVAKFVDDDGKGIWHGFPANCRRNLVPQCVLLKWIDNDYISKAAGRKVGQQQSWSP